mgnify:CR=1 FL=1
MAHIIWNASGYHIGLSANDTDKDYFLSHEPTATTTSISEADFLSLARKEKQLIAADHSKDNTDETRYECTKDNHEITDWDCGGRIQHSALVSRLCTQANYHLLEVMEGRFGSALSDWEIPV